VRKVELVLSVVVDGKPVAIRKRIADQSLARLFEDAELDTALESAEDTLADSAPTIDEAPQEVKRKTRPSK